MTPKQTAVINTLKVLAIGVSGGFLIAVLFSLFTLEQVGVGLAVLLLVAAIKLTYDIELSKAESLTKLNELSKK